MPSNRSKEQIEAIVEFTRQRSPTQIYLCPLCMAALQPGEVKEDFDRTMEIHGALFHRPCGRALVLYNRG